MEKEPKKRVYNKSHAEIILRVRTYFEEEKKNPEKINVDQVVQRTADATGVHRDTVSKVKNKESVENWKFKEGAKLIYNTGMKVPDNYEALVRTIVRDLFLKKERVPTIDIIFEKLKERTPEDVAHFNLFENENSPPTGSSVWPWCRSTLYNFMKSIGYIYGDRISPYVHKKSREDIILMRDNYLEWINHYRENGFNIFYQDETWVFKNMTCSKVWQDTAEDSTKDTFNVPSGKGERSILSHVGSGETGLLEGCMLLYRGAKANKSEDYHTEMNWDVFRHWCENTVFPAIVATGKKSVIVLDRAKYHTKLDDIDRKPVTSWNKQRLGDAIVRWGGQPEDWPLTWRRKKSKAQLLEQARLMYRTPIYTIQKIADKFSEGDFELKVLFLPVAHPELNPIEMVWGIIKRKVSQRNLTFKLAVVEEETRLQVAKLTPTTFQNFVAHAIKEEEKYRQLNVAETEE